MLVVRPLSDVHFTDLLNRLRIDLSADDIEMLKSREVKLTDNNYPTQALHVYRTNKCVVMLFWY